MITEISNSIPIKKILPRCLICGKKLMPEEPVLANFCICVYCYKKIIKKALTTGILSHSIPKYSIEYIVNDHIDFLIRANEWEIKQLINDLKSR